jgi:putative transposase
MLVKNVEKSPQFDKLEAKKINKNISYMVSNFQSLVKSLLGELPDDDYPVLNTFLFVSTWLNFALDQSQTSMRSLFKRLNVRGIKADISTFSKASKIETLFNSIICF